jgi:hypothetical protein
MTNLERESGEQINFQSALEAAGRLFEKMLPQLSAALEA